MKIIDPQHALEALQVHVLNISASYGANAEDVSQACWLSIFKKLRDNGPTELPLLVTIAKFAAIDEITELTGHGFTPLRSEVEPPPSNQVRPRWIGGTERDVEEPSATPHPTPYDLLDHLKSVAIEPDEIKLVEAGHLIAEASDADVESVNLGTTAELMRFSGLSAARVKAAQKSLLAKLRP